MVDHLVIPNTVQARHWISAGPTNGYVVTHHTIPSATQVDVNLANALFNSLKALWATQMAPLCPATAPNTVAYQGVILRDLRQANMAEISSNSAASLGTAATQDLLPRSIAACFTVRTINAGKRYRGRMYWFGFAETANGADGRMTAAAKTAFDAFATGFLTAANVNGLQFGVSHRPTIFDAITGLPVDPGLGFTTVATQVLCRDTRWDSQRRRSGKT